MSAFYWAALLRSCHRDRRSEAAPSVDGSPSTPRRGPMRFTDEHDDFRATVRALGDKEIKPHIDDWEREGVFPAHALFPRLDEFGLLGLE